MDRAKLRKSNGGLSPWGDHSQPIDAREQVFKLGRLGSTQAEIADVFNVSPSVISERFRTEIARGERPLENVATSGAMETS